MLYRNLVLAISLVLVAGCVDATTGDADDIRLSDTTDATGVDAPDTRGETPDCGAGPDTKNSPPKLPPFVAGPPPELFDCTAPAEPPSPQIWVDSACFLNPGCDTPMIVGHRGAGGNMGTIAPENSLQAIRAAIVMGLDAVELDVRHTADDGLVVLHDSTVDRTTDFEGEASSLSRAELSSMVLLPPKHSDLLGDFSCSRMPTLEEAFELTRDRIVVILDTKTDRVDLVADAILKASLVDQVFISVSDAGRAAAARAIDQNLRVQIRPASSEELDEMLLLFDRPPEIVEIPTDQVEPMALQIKALGAKVFTDVWVPDAIAYAEGVGTAYLDLYAAGAEILQSEYPPQVLKALEHWAFTPECP